MLINILQMIRNSICCRMLKRPYDKPSTRLMVEKKDLSLLLLKYKHQQIMCHNLHHLLSMLLLEYRNSGHYIDHGKDKLIIHSCGCISLHCPNMTSFANTVPEIQDDESDPTVKCLNTMVYQKSRNGKEK